MVTWKELALAFVVLAGIGAFAIGMIDVLAGGQSDNPEEGDRSGRQGCTLVIAGLVIALGAITLFVRFS